VVGYGIGGTGSKHGIFKLGGTILHELARIAMMSSMSRWSPVSGHPAMEISGNRSAVSKGETDRYEGE
jgi:hypothetical protein